MAARADFVLERPLLPDALVRAIESERDEDEGEELRILVDATARRRGRRPRDGRVVSAARWRPRPERASRLPSRRWSTTPPTGALEVEITAVMNSGELSIDVADDGPGFDALAALTAEQLDCTKGLGRIHALADGVRIERGDRQGTHVQLRFSVRTVEFDDEERIDLTDLDFFVPATARERS